MGRPKAWLPWFGRTLVEHVVDRVSKAVDEVVVVTSADLDLPPLPARVVRDREPERGPLAGLRDGLAAMEASAAFVTSTDTPFVTEAYVRELLAMGTPCAPRAEGHVQVLSAVYPKRAAALAARLLESGRARPLALLDALDARLLEPGALASLGEVPAWHGFNTPDAYLEGVRRVDPEATAEVELLGRAALHADETSRLVPVGTLGEALAHWPAALGLIDGERVARAHLASLAGRDLVRDLAVPVGPGERISVLDALAGG